MKKVAIVTFQNSIMSYGATLQNISLQDTIVNMGYDCETINLLRPCHPNYNKPETDDFWSAETLNFRKTLKTILFNIYVSITTSRLKTNRFHIFISKVKMSKCYKNHKELYEEPPQYDSYIAGSDQIWNPSFGYPLAPYFLTFVPEGRKKIAYAPSFGISQIPLSLKPILKEWLNNIDCLSVREKEGVKIIHELTRKNVELVMDPTFFLTSQDWQKYSKSPRVKKSYIFCFALGDQPRMMELCYHLKKITGYDIVKIGNNWRDIFNYKLITANQSGPSEFIGLIQNAAIIVTNSFHGTAFSINFNKPFYTIPSDSRSPEKSNNSRLNNILNLLGLQDRLFTVKSTLPLNKDLELDYSKVNIVLNRECNKSKEFLSKALQD